MTQAIGDITSTQFCCSGRFLSFLPGEKSPYQALALAVVQVSRAPSELTGTVQVKLGKALRLMMYRYLAPQDWITVVGQGKFDLRSGQMQWKAREIVKISPQLAPQRLAENALAEREHCLQNSTQPKQDVTRVLICQESGCRQRGSLAVSQAVEAALAKTGRSQQITVQATGCMKRCKAGPNMVMLPARASYQRITPEQASSLIASDEV